MKYDHSAGALILKMTDDVVCLQFKTDAAQVGLTTFQRDNYKITLILIQSYSGHLTIIGRSAPVIASFYFSGR